MIGTATKNKFLFLKKSEAILPVKSGRGNHGGWKKKGETGKINTSNPSAQ